jgi:parallel beta-helix repeat protein
MNTKIIASLILIITLLSTISGCIQQKETSKDNNNHHLIPINENSTIYVGITHADYSTIQEAIDAAVNGTTIIIENGSYNELIVINKTITLMGEDKNTTIINFNPNFKISQVPLITINANNCSIENLQITLSNISVIAQGISINSKYTTIKNNIIIKVTDGIELSAYSESNTIINNEIKNNLIGIMAISSNNNNISDNIFSSNTQYNIYLSTDSDYNRVSFNIMNNSDYGIRIKGSKFNTVYKNCIENNQIGIYCCCGAQDNHFYNNTLSNNSVRNAKEMQGLYNIWYDYPTGNGNYWDDYTGIDENHDGRGDTPYEIPEAGDKDMYPLMNPPIDAPCSK